MRKFKDKSDYGWHCGEKSVVEIGADKEFVLTQAKRLFNENAYHVIRAIACENCPVDVAAEPDFCVYEVAYMAMDGCSTNIAIVDEETAEGLLKEKLRDFMRGTALEHIRDFFEGEKKYA